MNYTNKMLWVIFWFFYTFGLGCVDVELFVFFNFIIAFSVVFIIFYKQFSVFSEVEYLFYILNLKKRINVYFLEYFTFYQYKMLLRVEAVCKYMLYFVTNYNIYFPGVISLSLVVQKRKLRSLNLLNRNLSKVGTLFDDLWLFLKLNDTLIKNNSNFK